MRYPVVFRVDNCFLYNYLFPVSNINNRSIQYLEYLVSMYVSLRGGSTPTRDVLQFRYKTPSIIALICGYAFLKFEKHY